MFPLRLVGIDMAASSTLGGGIRNFLRAAAFSIMMIGGRVIYEGRDARIGIALIVIGLPIFLLPWAWNRLLGRKRHPH